MDAREQRGLEIAATTKVRRNGTAWIVPSQSGNGSYKVDPEHGYCTCPDHEVRKAKCKHIFAVEFTIRRETNSRGETTVTKSVKVTYRQNWTAYNAAQTTEKAQFMALLSDLCKSIAEPEQNFGRPRLRLSVVSRRSGGTMAA